MPTYATQDLQSIPQEPRGMPGTSHGVHAVAFCLLLAAGCDRKDSTSATESTSSSEQKNAAAEQGPSGAAKPESKTQPPALPPEQVRKVVNPTNRAPYEGPTGSIRGRIVVTGDPAPEREDTLKRIPASCPGARETFRHVFREGMDRSLADVLVGVTEYRGYVPQRAPAVTVEARDCAWSTRTVALTYGQRIEVVSKDKNTYVPDLMGQSWPVQLFATPGGEPVSLIPQKPGQYVLLDSMRLFNAAEVYVVPFSTFDVTGLDGKFEITGLPPGSAKVSALLPVTGTTVEKTVEVQAGQAVTADLEIAFSRAEYEKRLAAAKDAAGKKAEPTSTESSTAQP